MLIATPDTLGACVWLSLQRILGTIAGGFIAYGLVSGVESGTGLAFCGAALAVLASLTKVCCSLRIRTADCAARCPWRKDTICRSTKAAEILPRVA